jgi:hypothetical protein
MMTVLKMIKGKIPIIVWRRSSWTSMPHMRADYDERYTMCGHNVELGDGIVGITLTQIDVEMFAVVGCGHCHQSMMRELKNDMIMQYPNMRDRYKSLMKTFEWYRIGDR